MKCRNCGKSIDDNKTFCKECENEMRKSSSKSDIKELEELIKSQKRLSDLEDTKELVNLNNLEEEKINDNLKDISNTVVMSPVEEEKIISKEEKNKELNNIEEIIEEVKIKKSNKKLVFIISCIVIFLILLFSIVLLLTSKNKKEIIKEEKTDYNVIINNYGNAVVKAVNKYLKDNETLPNWQEISELINYKEYDVICETHNIYSDGSIYLNNCKVNDKKVKYTYGKEKEEVKEGKKLNIYKYISEYNYVLYSKEQLSGYNLIATITCKTEDCDYINAYDKYVVVKEEDKYYLYDYENNLLEFGPFYMKDDYSDFETILVDNNKVYGVFYNENGINNLYNIKTGKTFKNLKGTLETNQMTYQPQLMLKYNYVVLRNNDSYDFVNLKTGNVSYSIKETISNFIEDTKNKIVYITAYKTDYNKFKIYNSNGKSLFDGEYFSLFTVANNNLVVSSDNKKFKVYDYNLKHKLTSKEYDKLLHFYENFIVVINNNHLSIVDINDKELATFEDEWDNNKYYFHSMLSGWYTNDDKYGIYLVVEDKEVPFGTMGSGIEYYYIPDTKEIGKIETTGIGGYAKPVLYLYPKEETKITINFDKEYLLTTTYPKFKNNWTVTAYPNGDLYDSTGKYYYALYWEEQENHNIDFSEGFYVTKENAIEFLEEKLSIIGLNDKEKNEFIMYWLPILEKNEKSLVYFELTNERDAYNKLIINPKPDSILRVAMHVKKVNKKTPINEQKLTTFNRNGFVAVEWGGVIHYR